MVILLEEEVVENLSIWLMEHDWSIVEKNLGHKHGPDLVASKEGYRLLVEAKGSKGNPKSHVTTRPRFNSGQIKDHFGKAIVKILEEKNKDPELIVAIAQPDDEYIKDVLQSSAEEVRKMGVLLLWVESATKVSVDSLNQKESRIGALPEFYPKDYPIYCRECQTEYNLSEWSVKSIIEDDGWFDCWELTCTKGHKIEMERI